MFPPKSPQAHPLETPLVCKRRSTRTAAARNGGLEVSAAQTAAAKIGALEASAAQNAAAKIGGLEVDAARTAAIRTGGPEVSAAQTAACPKAHGGESYVPLKRQKNCLRKEVQTKVETRFN